MKRITLILLMSLFMTSCVNDVAVMRNMRNKLSPTLQSKAELKVSRKISEYFDENYHGIAMSQCYDLIEFGTIERHIRHDMINDTTKLMTVVRYRLPHKFYYIDGHRKYRIECVWEFDDDMDFRSIEIKDKQYDFFFLDETLIELRNEIY